MRSTATATVTASPAQVWAVLSDHEGMSKWGPVKVTLTRHGDFERNGAGAQRTIKALPVVPPIVEEIVDFEPGQRLSYRGVSGIPFRNYVGAVQLNPTDSGTEISYTISADNPLPGVATVLANGLLFALKRAVKNAG